MRELLDRLRAATGPDREINLAIREMDASAFVANAKWKLAHVGPDYDGANSCDIYTPNGKLIEGFDYPRRGKISAYYHVHAQLGDLAYSASVDAALAFADRLFPGCWWLMSKGRVRPDEPLYACELLAAGDTEATSPIGAAEAPTLPLAILAALLTAKETR